MSLIKDKKLTKSSASDLVLYSVIIFAASYLTIRAFIPFALEMLR